MKYLDGIIITTDKYENLGIKKGTKGAIISPEIRNKTFDCELFDVPNDVYMFGIRIDEMEVTRESHVTDEEILQALPGNNPNWWCKVENGFIFNLKGEKKNKIPYDYGS